MFGETAARSFGGLTVVCAGNLCLPRIESFAMLDSYKKHLLGWAPCFHKICRVAVAGG